MIKVLVLISLILSGALFATETINPRIMSISANVKFDGYFLEAGASGIILNDSTGKFTLVLDSHNKIWFDDYFVISEKEKAQIKPHLIRMFEAATNKKDKAVLALFLKSILEI